MAGRPTKYTYTRIKRILKHLRNGGTKRGACGAAGIDADTITNWETRYSDFSVAIKKAQAHGLRSDLSRLDEFVKAGNLTALLARLKMVHGLSDRVTVKQTGTVKHEHSHKIKEAQKEYQAISKDKQNRIKAIVLGGPSRN